jgi:hypothetical protein
MGVIGQLYGIKRESCLVKAVYWTTQQDQVLEMSSKNGLLDNSTGVSAGDVQ